MKRAQKKKTARRKDRGKTRGKAGTKKSSSARPRTQYRTIKSLPPEAVQQLFRAAGWKGDLARYSRKRMRRKLNRSHLVVTAWQSKELIGLATAVSDGVLCAMVDNLVVHPDRRGQGVGGELMKRLGKELRRQGVEYTFVLGTRSPTANRFFEGAGYQAIPWRVFLHSPR